MVLSDGMGAQDHVPETFLQYCPQSVAYAIRILKSVGLPPAWNRQSYYGRPPTVSCSRMVTLRPGLEWGQTCMGQNTKFPKYNY